MHKNWSHIREIKNDYEYNAASLSLFNELKSNISQIVEPESDYYYYSIDIMKKKIDFYQIFLNNWGNGTTVGTTEAEKKIAFLKEEIILKERKEEEKLLRRTTDVIVNYEIFGSFTNLNKPKRLKG